MPPAKIELAFSPCPNDTFLFYPWIAGFINSKVTVEPKLADIEQLNDWAESNRYPVTKVSFAQAAQLLEQYCVLPVGAALGFGCGPKLVAKRAFDLCAISEKRVAVPGKRTTAHLLLQLLLPPCSKVYCRYDAMPALLSQDEVDAALIIHEQRFTFANLGFVEIADLGDLWEHHYRLPLPLGCLIARRDMQATLICQIIEAVRDAIDYAQANPLSVLPYVLQHSIEKDPDTVSKHIATYITQETAGLSAEGIAGVEALLRLGHSKSLLPAPRKWLCTTA